MNKLSTQEEVVLLLLQKLDKIDDLTVKKFKAREIFNKFFDKKFVVISDAFRNHCIEHYNFDPITESDCSDCQEPPKKKRNTRPRCEKCHGEMTFRSHPKRWVCNKESL